MIDFSNLCANIVIVIVHIFIAQLQRSPSCLAWAHSSSFWEFCFTTLLLEWTPGTHLPFDTTFWQKFFLQIAGYASHSTSWFWQDVHSEGLASTNSQQPRYAVPLKSAKDVQLKQVNWFTSWSQSKKACYINANNATSLSSGGLLDDTHYTMWLDISALYWIEIFERSIQNLWYVEPLMRLSSVSVKTLFIMVLIFSIPILWGYASNAWKSKPPQIIWLHLFDNFPGHSK